jgi:uncharacterized protein YkwD
MTFELWLFLLVIAGLFYTLLYLFKWRTNRKILTFKGRLLGHVNIARRRNHLRPLGRVKLLDKVAVGHSKSMATRKNCDHKDFDNRASKIKSKTGLNIVGENCYMFPARQYNARIARELVRGWLKSPGHRANILNSKFNRTGIGIAVRKGYVYATQIFTD